MTVDTTAEARSVLAYPTKPPTYASGLRQSNLRAVARGRWVAEQHFAYELSNDPMTILMSLKSTDPLGTAVLMPSADGNGEFELVRCRSIAEQTEFYRRSRNVSAIVEAKVFGSFGSDWYGLVDGVLTSRNVTTGADTLLEFVGLMPTARDEDTSIAEIGFGRLYSEGRDLEADLAWRGRALHSRQQRLARLQAGDLGGLAALYAPNATVVAKAPRSSEQITLVGRDEIASYYGSVLADLGGSPAVDLLVSHIHGWFSFTEFVWESENAIYRTADVSNIGADGLIAYELGYASDQH
jgi:hypothetical protein